MFNKISSILFLTPLIMGAPAALAQGPGEFCANPALNSVPVLSEGRAMPLKLHASKMRSAIFSGDRCKQASATELYCALSMGMKDSFEAKYHCKLQLKADHAETFALLGLPNRQSPITPELAVASHERLLAQYHLFERQGKSSSGAGSDLGALLTRIDRYESITHAQDWRVLTSDHQWVPLSELPVSTPSDYSKTIMGSIDHVTSQERSLMRFEVLYDQTHPFAFGILIALIGLVILLGASKSNALGRMAKFAMIALIGVEIFGISLRVLISGRAPVTNMFETVMWVGFCVLILSFILGIKLRNRAIWAVGFAGNVISLFMLNFATGMLDNSIQPLVPVLRDNFWLSTHVTAVTSSYACFTFAWILSDFILIRRLLGNRSEKFLEDWNYVVRIGMQIGTVLLAGGIILGGVWADYSWGRFWGWDPKETWSLIALVIYITILHGRYVGWFRGVRFTHMASLAYLSVIMAWFGVNYILAVGLHSYGFSSGGAIFIGSVTFSQLAILAISIVSERRLRSA